MYFSFPRWVGWGESRVTDRNLCNSEYCWYIELFNTGGVFFCIIILYIYYIIIYWVIHLFFFIFFRKILHSTPLSLTSNQLLSTTTLNDKQFDNSNRAPGFFTGRPKVIRMVSVKHSSWIFLSAFIWNECAAAYKYPLYRERYTFKAFFPSAFQGTSLNTNPFSFYSEKHIIEGAFTIPRYSSSLLFSEDTQPFTETLAGPPPLGPLPPVSVLWKNHCSLGVLDAGTVPIRTNTVCRTNIFVLLNLIMHGVAK